MLDRYVRQLVFPEIGKEGQEKIGQGTVTVIGCGALGSVSSAILVRAGVGKVKIVDRDFIEYHNLARQLLYDENDIQDELPKAIAAKRHLQKVNSTIQIEGIVADVTYTNIEELIRGSDVVVDGLDNMETRFLINDACLKQQIPWIYGGAIASMGMTATFLPNHPPCWRCFNPHATRGAIETCESVGVVTPAPAAVGALQAAEALKLLVGSPEINLDLITLDIWYGSFDRIKISPRLDCPACHGDYEFLNGRAGLRTTVMCGQSSVQLWNPAGKQFHLPDLAARLRPLGKISLSDYLLRFEVEGHELVIFQDGRAILRDSGDTALARSLYARYVGT